MGVVVYPGTAFAVNAVPSRLMEPHVLPMQIATVDCAKKVDGNLDAPALVKLKVRTCLRDMLHVYLPMMNSKSIYSFKMCTEYSNFHNRSDRVIPGKHHAGGSANITPLWST